MRTETPSGLQAGPFWSIGDLVISVRNRGFSFQPCGVPAVPGHFELECIILATFPASSQLRKSEPILNRAVQERDDLWHGRIDSMSYVDHTENGVEIGRRWLTQQTNFPARTTIFRPFADREKLWRCRRPISADRLPRTKPATSIRRSSGIETPKIVISITCVPRLAAKC